jgi:hypothetical protein
VLGFGAAPQGDVGQRAIVGQPRIVYALDEHGGTHWRIIPDPARQAYRGSSDHRVIASRPSKGAGTMNDLSIIGNRSRGSMIRLVRAGAGLFVSGFVAGLVVALIFHALITTFIIVAATVIVAIALVRMLLRRKT